MKSLRILLLGALALWALVLLLLRVRFELLGSFHSDASIYLTVSRGILNGLTPYADLYENKPPGLFLLGALSLQLFNGPQLLTYLQALVILLFPLCLVLPVAYGRVYVRTPERLLVAWILGCALALYSAVMAGQLLPESFGAFFASVFVALTVMYPENRSWKRNILLALFLLLAVGIKEPFLIAAFSGALIALPSFRAARGLIPVITMTIVIGILALLCTGFASAYVQVDLAHVFGHHVSHPWGTVGEPAWLRFNDVIRIWKNMAAFTPVFPFVLTALWIGTWMLLIRRESSRRAQVWVTLRWLLASFLATFTVGLTGDFYGHHFIFAVPFYVGCALVCFREWKGESRSERASLLVIALAFAALLSTIQTDFRSEYDNWRVWAQERTQAAAVLDSVMDRCRIDQYFDNIDRPEGFYGFTRHSPYGPIFTQYGRFIGAMDVYLQGFARALGEAPIMVIKTPQEAVQMDPGTQAFLQQQFSEIPWACAGPDFSQPLPYRILFRIGAR